MRPAFHPRLVNGPFDDPGLFIPFVFEHRALLFDLGDISALTPKDVLKISHVFITHTHMDHFVGFDRLLRLFLGREKRLHIYGPEGFFKNVEGKLSGYTWNLVNNYDHLFILDVTEVHEKHLLSKDYSCHKGFLPSRRTPKKSRFNDTLLEEHGLTVTATRLEHDIPCLGFSMKERFHVNIIKENLEKMGLEIGPWINAFKQALYKNLDPDTPFDVECGGEPVKNRRFSLGDLKDKIALITPGQKITYIVDVAYTDANIDKIVSLAKDSDQLFIEAAFCETHKDTAKEKHHLTAKQAGQLAAKAGVKQFTLFHFSPRYMEEEALLQEEAMEAYTETMESNSTSRM